jgi:alcohol dehydrogenase
MQAVLTMAHGGRENLKFVADHPKPTLGAGQVLVRIAATAINYHDIFTRRGMPGISIKLPIVVGSDVAGEVVELGEGVTDWPIGSRVLLNPMLRDGRFGMIGETVDGGRAEFVAVDFRQLIHIPENVSFQAAASLPLAYGTAHRMMISRGRVSAGERVLILGASGGVGVACLQIAKILGATVVACASSISKLDRLANLGADHCVDYSKSNITDAISHLFGKPRVTGSGGVDVAINFTGGETWKDTQRCVRLGGRILTCGATAGYEVNTDVRYLWTFEHNVIGSNGWRDDDLRALLALISEGSLCPAIDRVLPLEEAAEAERLLEDREVVGKVLLQP